MQDEVKAAQLGNNRVICTGPCQQQAGQSAFGIRQVSTSKLILLNLFKLSIRSSCIISFFLNNFLLLKESRPSWEVVRHSMKVVINTFE